jgi:hypothetical protein
MGHPLCVERLSTRATRRHARPPCIAQHAAVHLTVLPNKALRDVKRDVHRAGIGR